LQVNDDKKKIRRSPDLPLPVMNEERRQELTSRTVYCKGFPRDDTTLDTLLEFFSSYGPVENIQVMTSTFENFIYSQMSYVLSLCVRFQETEIVLSF
jgi:RNA recognition motif-containing protein